ncbi:hypothetical protein GT625_13555 [Burkholderia thailandensis]|uniref:hypothetical protein n=1 Tax=Burkholderia thailandensis TaxID=57975 RepID=UPI0013773AA3|nr:hypothetical protein [Burkholderia thailandensis]NBJ19751.1 hypothetical protein [Burkholderia thailandensis]
MQQIADELRVSKQSVSECLRVHRSEWHIARRIPRAGLHAWVIALGEGDDASAELCAKTLSQYSKARPNPFLVAAGAVAAPTSHRGRVISMMDEPETV